MLKHQSWFKWNLRMTTVCVFQHFEVILWEIYTDKRLQRDDDELVDFWQSDWCFGTMEFYDLPYIGNFIIPTDELHHFSQG